MVPASLTNLPSHVALERGIFEKHGLDVSLEVPTVPFNQLPNALGKEYDVIITSIPNVVNARDSGLDLVIMGSILRDSDWDPGAALVVPPDSPVNGIEDLAGRTVGAPSVAGSNWTTLLCWADKEGVDPDRIRGVEAPTPQIPDLLESGRFDAALIFQPGLGLLERRGYKNLGSSYRECFGERIVTSSWVSTGDWVRSHRDEIDRFQTALREAVRFIDENPRETREIWLETSGLPRELAGATPLRPEAFVFDNSREELLELAELWLDLMRRLGVYEGDVQPSDLVP
jgi:NitT/TauT family transport system substrate-binding protein